MKRVVSERNIVLVLFILVMAVFSMANQDSKHLDNLYTSIDPAKNAVAALKAPADSLLHTK